MMEIARGLYTEDYLVLEIDLEGENLLREMKRRRR